MSCIKSLPSAKSVFCHALLPLTSIHRYAGGVECNEFVLTRRNEAMASIQYWKSFCKDIYSK